MREWGGRPRSDSRRMIPFLTSKTEVFEKTLYLILVHAEKSAPAFCQA